MIWLSIPGSALNLNPEPSVPRMVTNFPTDRSPIYSVDTFVGVIISVGNVLYSTVASII